jgi:hypothetical protein
MPSLKQCPVSHRDDCRNCLHRNECAREKKLPRAGIMRLLLSELKLLLRL